MLRRTSIPLRYAVSTLRSGPKMLALSALLLSLTPASVFAASCPANPNTLTNGQTADATQVMGNFNNLLTCTNTALADHGVIVNSRGQQYAGSGLPSSIVLGSITGVSQYRVTASFEGRLSNDNGTPILSRLLISVKDGTTTRTSSAYEASVVSGFAGVIAFTFSFAVAQPAANALTITVTDTESDGGSHSWTVSNFSASVTS